MENIANLKMQKETLQQRSLQLFKSSRAWLLLSVALFGLGAVYQPKTSHDNRSAYTNTEPAPTLGKAMTLSLPSVSQAGTSPWYQHPWASCKNYVMVHWRGALILLVAVVVLGILVYSTKQGMIDWSRWNLFSRAESKEKGEETKGGD